MAGKIFIASDRFTSTLEKLSAKIDLWIPASLQSDKRGPTGFVPYHTGVVPYWTGRAPCRRRRFSFLKWKHCCISSTERSEESIESHCRPG